jgi:uncharacterized membrane protein
MPQLLLVGAPDFLTDEDVRNKITIDFDVLVSAVTRSPEGIYVTIHNAAAADLVFAAGCLKFKGVDYTLQWHATPCHEHPATKFDDIQRDIQRPMSDLVRNTTSCTVASTSGPSAFAHPMATPSLTAQSLAGEPPVVDAYASAEQVATQRSQDCAVYPVLRRLLFLCGVLCSLMHIAVGILNYTTKEGSDTSPYTTLSRYFFPFWMIILGAFLLHAEAVHLRIRIIEQHRHRCVPTPLFHQRCSRGIMYIFVGALELDYGEFSIFMGFLSITLGVLNISFFVWGCWHDFDCMSCLAGSQEVAPPVAPTEPQVLESDAAMVTTEHSLSHVSEWQRSHEPPASDTTPISEAYTGVAVVAAPKPQPSKHPSLDAMALLEKQHKDSLGSNVTYFE